MKTVPFTYTCPNELCHLEIEYQISPGRPAPVCSNPSSPLFSDSGDPAEIDGPDTCPGCSHDLDLDVILDEALEKVDWSVLSEHEYPDREPDWDEQPRPESQDAD